MPLILDPTDQANLALCVWKEARGEGLTGMKAVAHVICNRVGGPGFPATLHDVIYQKNAFTSMSVPSDPEYNLVPGHTDQVYQLITEWVSKISTDLDPTHGALYYANLRNVTSGWFIDHIVNCPTLHPLKVKINRQTFFG